MRTPQKLRITPKSYKKYIYGITAILIISCSIFAYNIPLINSSPFSRAIPLTRLGKQPSRNQDQSNPLQSLIPSGIFNRLSEEELNKLEEYKEYLTFSGVDQEALDSFEQNLEKLENPEKYKEKAYDYFSDHWVPEESIFNLSSDEIPNFEDSLKSVFFNDWLKAPSYSLIDEDGNEIQPEIISQDDQYIETVKSMHMDGFELIEKSIITPNQEITERSAISEDFYIKEVTKTGGKPRITLIEPDFSGLNRFQVPILSQEDVNSGKGASSAEDVEWLTQTLDLKAGFAFDTPENWQWRREWGIPLVVNFEARAIFDFSFHFAFPIRFIIEYPAEVIEGGDYQLKITMIPLDLPDYNEFEFRFLIDVGFTLIVFGITIFNVPLIYYYFELNESYITPLAGDWVDIDLGIDIDIIELLADKSIPYVSAICAVLQFILRCGIGVGMFRILGDCVSGLLEVSTGGTLASKRNSYWKYAGDSETLEFKVPQSEEENSYLDLAISKVVYHSDLFWVPTFFIGLKDILIFPLEQWFDEFRTPIAFIPLLRMNLPVLEKYPPILQTATVAPTSAYDFSMNVTEISPDQGQGTFTGVTTHTQMYSISLSNLAGRTDNIELGVQGLPEGYTTFFDSVTPLISGTPTTVYLIITPPEHIKVPPGERPFNITATSLGRRNTGLQNDTVIQSSNLSVPVLVDLALELDLDYHPAEIIQVTPNMTLPLNFYGGNLGNLDDNITVTASIYNSETILRTWESNFSVYPYGAGIDQYYSGEFNFTYDKDDLFPTPGLYTLDIIATSQKWPIIIDMQRRVLNFTTYYDLETSIDPQMTTLFANFETNFRYTFKNTGNAIGNFTLSSSGWDDYLSYPNKILNVESNETREVVINLKVDNPDILPPTLYDFRIEAIPDGSDGTVFSVDVVEVNVLPSDYVAPAITFLPQYLSPVGLIFPQSNLTFGLVWEAFDPYPQSYTVYIDSEIYDVNNWENETPVFVPVTAGTNPFFLGDHNVTIVFSDASNNVATDQVWITIVPSDVTQPSIVSVTNPLTIPQNFSYTHFLIWNCTEEFLLNSTIYRNGSKISTDDLLIEQKKGETSTFRTKCLVRPGSLPVGVWNFTLFIQDMSDYSVSSTIFVTVTPADSDPPQITITPNLGALFRNGETLSFTATDTHPDRFELWIDGKIECNTTWQSDIPVNLNVDNLNLLVGANDLELYLFDLAGLFFYYPWIFTLQDVDPPTFLIEPSDFSVNEHEISVFDVPYWHVHDYDLHLGTFQIFCDGVLVEEDSWAIGQGRISVPIVNLVPGIHEYYGIFKDASGNSLFSTLFVTINDVLAPYIWPHDPIRFEPLYTPSWFEFYITESHLQSYSLYLDDVLIDQGSLSEEFPFLLIDLSSIPTGQHLYKLEALDQFGNIGEEFVQITVTDYSPPFIKRPPDLFYSEGDTGRSITWEIFEANPRDYSLYLNGDLIESGTSIGENITTSVDSLELGLYEYFLVVYDDKGFSHSASCFVVVVDITPPTLTHISDCRFVLGDPNSMVIWEAYDLHPASYIIKRNGVIIRPLLEWAGEDIMLSFVGWTPGSHEIEVVVSDTSGNVATDTFVVTLVEVEEVSTIEKPGLSPGFSFTLVLVIIIIFSRIQRKKEE